MGGEKIVFFIVQPEARGYLKAKLRDVFLFLASRASLASSWIGRIETYIETVMMAGEFYIPKSKNPEMNAKLSPSKQNPDVERFEDLLISTSTATTDQIIEDFDDIEESQRAENLQRVSEMLEKKKKI